MTEESPHFADHEPELVEPESPDIPPLTSASQQ